MIGGYGVGAKAGGGGNIPNVLQIPINGTTDGTGVYVLAVPDGALEGQFFLDGGYKAPTDGHTWTSGTKTLTISPDIAGVAYSFSYYIP